MTPEAILAIVGGVIIFITFIVVIARRMPKRIKSVHYVRKWREIQKMCANKKDWAHAIIHADMLLDEVMVKKKTTGNTMGERLVATQDSFTNNEKVWNAHKFADGLRENGDKRLKERIVKEALVTYRQALRDLGAI
jgi:hypothetical protein